MKKVVAVNCSPRRGWNTDLLVRAAARGAENAGASVKIFDLNLLEPFTGCASCFGCKLAPNEGRCVCLDGLYPVLEAIRTADALILGTPVYLSNVSSGFHALYERLVFQNTTYQKERPSYRTRRIPVLLAVTSGVAVENYGAMGYDAMIESYRRILDRSVGETKVVTSGDVLQVSDYSRFNWTLFDPEAKKKGRQERFPKDLEQAAKLGAGLVE